MEDVIFKDQIWSFSSTPHAVHHFSLATVCHIGIRIAKRVANWKSWQLFVLWWFGHTVSSSDGFLSSTRLLDSTLLSLGIFEVHWLELPRFFIRFLFPTPHFLSFITVCGCVGGGNVLSYRTTCFGNDQQNLRNLQDSLQMFAVLFALQIPMYRVAQCGAPSVEALACQGPWAWRWTVMYSTIF